MTLKILIVYIGQLVRISQDFPISVTSQALSGLNVNARKKKCWPFLEQFPETFKNSFLAFISEINKFNLSLSKEKKEIQKKSLNKKVYQEKSLYEKVDEEKKFLVIHYSVMYHKLLS